MARLKSDLIRIGGSASDSKKGKGKKKSSANQGRFEVTNIPYGLMLKDKKSQIITPSHQPLSVGSKQATISDCFTTKKRKIDAQPIDNETKKLKDSLGDDLNEENVKRDNTESEEEDTDKSHTREEESEQEKEEQEESDDD